MIADNQVLIISQCDDGAVTVPILDKFQQDIGADVWHHIAVPPMSTEEFYFIIGQIHNFIQTLIDERDN